MPTYEYKDINEFIDRSTKVVEFSASSGSITDEHLALLQSDPSVMIVYNGIEYRRGKQDTTSENILYYFSMSVAYGAKASGVVVYVDRKMYQYYAEMNMVIAERSNTFTNTTTFSGTVTMNGRLSDSNGSSGEGGKVLTGTTGGKVAWTAPDGFSRVTGITAPLSADYSITYDTTDGLTITGTFTATVNGNAVNIPIDLSIPVKAGTGITMDADPTNKFLVVSMDGVYKISSVTVGTDTIDITIDGV